MTPSSPAGRAPTLRSGDRVLFARVPWGRGSIVMADVGESAPVVKRVFAIDPAGITLAGDNLETTESYHVDAECVRTAFVCRIPLPSLGGDDHATASTSEQAERPAAPGTR